MVPARTSLRTEAIVLRTIDYGESDRIVTFCTADFGKLRGIAKGARRSRKRFANTIEPFCFSRILFSRKNPDGLALIEGADIISHFPGIRANLEKTMTASCMIDLTDQFTPEDKKNETSFCLLRDFLKLVEETDSTEALLRFFEIRLLQISGYDPVLDRCISCGKPLENGASYRFDTHKSGLICNVCGWANREAVPVSLGTIRSLLLGRDMDIDRLRRLRLSGRSADESRLLLSGFIRHLLGRELKSINVLNEIRLMRI